MQGLILWRVELETRLAVEDPKDPQRHLTLACDHGLNWSNDEIGRAEPWFGSWIGIDLIPDRGTYTHSASGNLIIFEKATKYDVANMVSRFSGRWNVEEWLKDCARTTGVSAEVLEVLREGVQLAERSVAPDRVAII